MNGPKEKAQKAPKKEKDPSPVFSQCCPQDMVLLGSEESCNKGSKSGSGPYSLRYMRKASAVQPAQNTRSRSHSANRKATYRFLRLGTLPRKDVQYPATSVVPSLPQGKNRK